MPKKFPTMQPENPENKSKIEHPEPQKYKMTEEGMEVGEHKVEETKKEIEFIDEQERRKHWYPESPDFWNLRAVRKESKDAEKLDITRLAAEIDLAKKEGLDPREVIHRIMKNYKNERGIQGARGTASFLLSINTENNKIIEDFIKDEASVVQADLAIEIRDALHKNSDPKEVWQSFKLRELVLELRKSLEK